jgi:hypothetical protein
MSRKPKILSVSIEHSVDDCPDLSWLGEYSDHDAPGAIDRKARGDAGSREYQYWIPGDNHNPHSPAGWAHVDDRHVIIALNALPAQQKNDAAKRIDWPARYDRGAAIEYLDKCYIEQDYQRCEAYNRGDWYCMGVIAKARVQLAGSDVVQTVRSSGLWGVESDSGDYIDETHKAELDALRSELSALGCSDRQINAAYKNVRYPD